MGKVKKRRPNNYVIDGDVVKMELTRNNGESMYTIFDLEDLDKVIGFMYSWHVRHNRSNNMYYCVSTTNRKFRNLKTLHLHMFIIDFYDNGGKEKHVDHINHNTLDNRKCNLRITDACDNLKNRSGKNSNNTSGYRNVSKINGKWVVQLQVDGKNKVLGRFIDIDEAGRFAEEMRNEYYNEYKGVS